MALQLCIAVKVGNIPTNRGGTAIDSPSDKLSLVGGLFNFRGITL